MKKNLFKKIISLTVVFILMENSAWSKTVDPIAVSPQSFRFDETKKYVIELKDHRKIKGKGATFHFDHDDLFFVDPKTGDQSKYQINDIGLIHERKGTHALLGAGIGAAAGIGMGAVIGGLSSRDCSQAQSDQGDCETMNSLGIVVGIPVGLVLGGLTGLGIGSIIKKENKIVLSPMVSWHQNYTVYGVGFSKSF